MALRVLRNNHCVRNMSFLFNHGATESGFLRSQRSLTTSKAPSFALPASQQLQNGKPISIAYLLQSYGFSEVEGHSLLARSRFLLDSDVSKIEQCLKILFVSFKLPRDGLISMICRCPGILDAGFLKKWEKGVLDLKHYGFSPLAFMRLLEISSNFLKEPSQFSERVRVLEGLGFSAGTISRVLEEFPRIVMVTEFELRKRVGFLALYGLGGDELNHICSSFPGLLGFGVEDRLRPLLDEFTGLGFRKDVLRQEIINEPRILSMELGELPQLLKFLEKLRCRVPIKEKIYSDGELKAGFAVKLRVDCLCSYSLIRRDALSVVKREPRIIMYEISDTVKKIEFLLQRMKMNVGCLVDVPEYLGVNFDKQIVPRYHVIEYLRSVGGLGFDVSLKDMIKPSTLKFYNLYVKPYPDCQKLFCRSSGDTKAQSHPIGLWKLFKPPKYTESKQDVENIRLFMEPLA